MDIRQTENGKLGWCHSIRCDFHSANQLARLGLDVAVQRVNELVLTTNLMIMIKENAKILPATWLDWKMWPRYFFEANNDRVLAARPLTFLKAMEPTDISAIAPPTSTCNSIWKYIFHITLQSNLSFEIMWHIIILLVIIGKNDSKTNTEIMQLCFFVFDNYLDAPMND